MLTLGRFEDLQASSLLERLVRSARFGVRAMVLSAASDEAAIKIGVRRIGQRWFSSGCGRRPAAGRLSRQMTENCRDSCCDDCAL
jgi:hypothetical protein